MATSATMLSTIIDTLAKKYSFDKDDAISLLAKNELLPKKLLPKDATAVSMFASKKAEELAAERGFVPKGNGSGKDGKWTLKDIESAMVSKTKTKILISPNALNLANEHGINIGGRTGTGKDGRILIKDVENWLAADNDSKDDIDISPRALQEATENGIKKDDLSTIHGTGKNGRILLSDVQKHISESEKSSDDDESDEE